MAANSPLLRPLGIAAGGLGSFQAITWGILSLLGILVYIEVIEVRSSKDPADAFQLTLVSAYFISASTFSEVLDITTPGTVVVWTSIYFGTSVIWLVISGLLLYDSYKSKFTSIIIIGWVAVTAVVAAIDIAGTVVFGLDYDRVKSFFDDPNNTSKAKTEIYFVPIFMMIMCARGFVLWIMNVGLVIYLGVAARKLCRKGSPNLLPGKLSRYPTSNSHYYDSMGATTMYSSPKVDSSSQGRQNSTFQPDPIYAWDTQSPIVGNQQPSQRDFPPQNTPRVNDVRNPITPIPRIGRTAATPMDLQPTPQPDYSPPTRRPVKHEPYMYEAPTRSVLKNPNAPGHTNF